MRLRRLRLDPNIDRSDDFDLTVLIIPTRFVLRLDLNGVVKLRFRQIQKKQKYAFTLILVIAIARKLCLMKMHVSSFVVVVVAS